MDQPTHAPVLLGRVLEGLAIKHGGLYIDATLGAGGHSLTVLQTAPRVKILGIDLDPQMLALARQNLAHFSDQVVFVEGNFRHLHSIAVGNGLRQVDGVLFDLGLSSIQLHAAGRGFSFQEEGPLDMRFSPRQEKTAADLVNRLPEKELADLIWEYGQERHSRAIARAILSKRPVKTTTQLAEIVARTLRRRGKIHPATRTFQALRMAVNEELSALQEALPQAVDILASGGRLVVISFHSLEDRIVKIFMRGEPRLEIITRKPIRPSSEEIESNPRSRSAKLRVAQRRG
ncbi:MAG: 16S rRNA (cytosine(1402)-N(4))-methyltransferase RsmH [Chloroflexi bacterium]|nr:16S rRNA (cytosine(1402)-N(4))-methyltransferase RsmH [Chloroflexota bacterium]